MPWLKQTGAIWAAQQQGAFIKRRMLEPEIEMQDRPLCPATARLCEFLPGEQFAAVCRWAAGLPRLKEKAA